MATIVIHTDKTVKITADIGYLEILHAVRCIQDAFESAGARATLSPFIKGQTPAVITIGKHKSAILTGDVSETVFIEGLEAANRKISNLLWQEGQHIMGNDEYRIERYLQLAGLQDSTKN